MGAESPVEVEVSARVAKGSPSEVGVPARWGLGVLAQWWPYAVHLVTVRPTIVFFGASVHLVAD